jgi:outer membrane autotransporter protein
MPGRKLLTTGIGGIVLCVEMFPKPALATCNNGNPGNGISVTCTGAGVLPVIAQGNSTGVDIAVDSTVSAAAVHATAPVFFSVAGNSAIDNNGSVTLTGGGGSGTARGAVLLGTGDGNRLVNDTSGSIVTSGAYNDGMAANGSGNSLVNRGSISTTGPNAYGMSAAWGQTNVGQSNNTLTNTGTVSTTGSNARAMSILGGSGTVNNSGSLSTSGANSPTAYMQGNNDHLINSGTITANGAGSDAVFSNTAGSSFAATIENLAGGQIVSQNAAAVRTLNGASTVINAGLLQGNAGTAVSMGTGTNSLILQTGSVIIGAANGGGAAGTAVVLQGTGTASNAFTGFPTLRMAGDAWTFSGTGDFNLAEVQTGTLNLTGAFGPSTSALVDAAATLQARAQNLPGTVIDNGLVRFAQADAGLYNGTISGSGAVQKTGAGTLTLTPLAAAGNSYAGGTTIDSGTLAVGADNALGAGSGGLTFNGGTLQLNGAFDLAATRAVTLNGPGGTIDTQGFASTLEQGIGGSGALTKAGSGALLLNGANSYSGGTTIAAGALYVGDDAHRNAALAGGGPIGVAAGTTLGGYGSVTGNVANQGTIAVANAVQPFAQAGNGAFTVHGNLDNSGLVQIAGPGAGPGAKQGVGNTLVVSGNYVGHAGRIALNTVLGDDHSASDKLVVDGGAASGSSSLLIANAGGTGAATTGDGIQVVQATNGATTAPGAFSLPASLKAGAYSYFLAKGGVSDGTAQSWYLRNNVAAAQAPPPGSAPGTPAADAPIAAPGTPPLPAAPPPGSAPIPLYRPEVALYAEMPSVVRQLGIGQIDNFHDRQGEQDLLTENGALPAAWGRMWGGHAVTSQSGAVSPQFDGSVFGAQAGQDLYANTSASGQRNHFGVFAGFARATGDVDGFAVGMPNVNVGQLDVNAYSLGGYWTHVGPTGWYTDAVLMGSSITIDPRSRDGVGANTHGSAVAGSIEGGFPIPLTTVLTIEPQAQLTWQHLSINDLNDGVSTVSFNSGNTYLGRLGVRLKGHFDSAGVNWQPYVRMSVLRSFGTDDQANFGGTTVIPTGVGQTAGQIGAGVVARLGRSSSAFATASYLANLGGAHQRTVMGNAGVRWAW